MKMLEPDTGTSAKEPTGGPSNFIRDAMIEDLKTGKVTRVQTRFPPEPNGYLHIGHAKAICLDFGLPAEFGGGPGEGRRRDPAGAQSPATTTR